MKRLTCEMCGSTDLVKQEGVFVCQNCGTQYSVEEAKKMMIEGTVEVKGTVEVDNSAFFEKSLLNARRALQKGDWEETERYYNIVEQNDPKNIEAIFYSAYGKTRMSMFEENIYKRKQICDVFCRMISVIDDYYDAEKTKENQNIISQMNRSMMNMYTTPFIYNTTVNAQGVKSDNKNSTYYLFAQMSLAFIETITNIVTVDDQLIYWKIIYQQRKYLVGNPGLSIKARNANREIALTIGKRIHAKDPSFAIEEIAKVKKSGCYVASCIYGSYDCPEVWTLRRYRDDTLGTTWYGRAFIRVYYAISPTVVKWFGDTNWFKNMCKKKLDCIIGKLRSKGVQDTPYEDKNW